jgi:hypothetical protein
MSPSTRALLRRRPDAHKTQKANQRARSSSDTREPARRATARLSFEMIEVNRAFIRDALAQFAAIVEAFPVRGDITAD